MGSQDNLNRDGRMPGSVNPGTQALRDKLRELGVDVVEDLVRYAAKAEAEGDLKTASSIKQAMLGFVAPRLNATDVNANATVGSIVVLTGIPAGPPGSALDDGTDSRPAEIPAEALEVAPCSPEAHGPEPEPTPPKPAADTELQALEGRAGDELEKLEELERLLSRQEPN
jgi:hypothetical protein